MITSLLTASDIQLQVEVHDWQDAIRKGGQLLVASKAVEAHYVDAMIDAANQLGPYFVLVPGVAMPHARSEAGVLKMGLSLITLKKPVPFLNSPNNPVSIVLCFAATDPGSHLSVMHSLAQFLDSKEDIVAVENADRAEQVLEIMGKYH